MLILHWVRMLMAEEEEEEEEDEEEEDEEEEEMTNINNITTGFDNVMS